VNDIEYIYRTRDGEETDTSTKEKEDRPDELCELTVMLPELFPRMLVATQETDNELQSVIGPYRPSTSAADSYRTFRDLLMPSSSSTSHRRLSSSPRSSRGRHKEAAIETRP